MIKSASHGKVKQTCFTFPWEGKADLLYLD